MTIVRQSIEKVVAVSDTVDIIQLSKMGVGQSGNVHET